MKLRYRLQTHRYAVWKNLVVMTFRVLSAEKKRQKKQTYEDRVPSRYIECVSHPATRLIISSLLVIRHRLFLLLWAACEAAVSLTLGCVDK